MVVNKSGLEKLLMDLVKLWVLLLNGCVYCIDMYFCEVKVVGECEEWFYLLSVWEEMYDFYMVCEKVVLCWIDVLMEFVGNYVSDEMFEVVSEYFIDEEMGNFMFVIVVINGWNWFSVGFVMLIWY